jgi:hypothetical protein
MGNRLTGRARPQAGAVGASPSLDRATPSGATISGIELQSERRSIQSVSSDLLTVGFIFELLLEVGQDAKAGLLEFTNPPVSNLVDGHRVKIVQFLTAAPEDNHEVCPLQYDEMLGDSLPAHVQMLTELAQGLPVVGVQTIKQQSPTGIGERLERFVHVGVHNAIVQLGGCMSTHRIVVGSGSEPIATG